MNNSKKNKILYQDVSRKLGIKKTIIDKHVNKHYPMIKNELIQKELKQKKVNNNKKESEELQRKVKNKINKKLKIQQQQQQQQEQQQKEKNNRLRKLKEKLFKQTTNVENIKPKEKL